MRAKVSGFHLREHINLLLFTLLEHMSCKEHLEKEVTPQNPGLQLNLPSNDLVSLSICQGNSRTQGLTWGVAPQAAGPWLLSHNISTTTNLRLRRLRRRLHGSVLV